MGTAVTKLSNEEGEHPNEKEHDGPVASAMEARPNAKDTSVHENEDEPGSASSQRLHNRRTDVEAILRDAAKSRRLANDSSADVDDAARAA